MASRLVISQAVISLLAAAVSYYLVSANQGFTIFACGVLLTINWSLHTWGWSRILRKKSIALAASAIVIKYAIFGAGVIFLINQKWFDKVGLVIGLTLLFPTLIVFGYLAQRAQQNESRG